MNRAALHRSPTDPVTHAFEKNAIAKNALTIDVEDWFHILGLGKSMPVESWRSHTSLVEKNTLKFLSLLKKHNAKATFFVLGWVAQHFPDLVREIEIQGHEIGTHGYRHELVFDQTPDQFKRDIDLSLEYLIRTVRQPILGYRAPGFSITNDALWALDILLEAGLQYDASIFPMSRNHGGYKQFGNRAGWLETPKGHQIFEVPVSCNRVLGRKVFLLGGGYFRLAPYWAIALGIRQLNKAQQPAVVYLHPREIDPTHPRLKMNLKRTFMSYVNVHTTTKKLEKILQTSSWSSISDIWTIDQRTSQMDTILRAKLYANSFPATPGASLCPLPSGTAARPKQSKTDR